MPSTVNHIDALLELMEELYAARTVTYSADGKYGVLDPEGVLSDDDPRLQRVEELDAKIGASASGPFPDLAEDSGGTIQHFGFCRIPYEIMVGGILFFTNKGFSTGLKWHQEMRILRAREELKSQKDNSDRLKTDVPSDGPAESINEDEMVETTTGRRCHRDDFTDEDRPTGEWAAICGFSVETFRNRMDKKKKGRTWRIVQVNKGNYIVHKDDLSPAVRGSKRIRDDKVKAAGM